MIKFSKFTWAILITFAVAFLCVMLNMFWQPFIYGGLVALFAGFTMVAVRLFISTNKKYKHTEMVQEELLMELAVTDDGEQYVVNKSNQKKRKRELKRQKLEGMIPALMCCFVALLMLFFLIKIIVGF